MCPHPLIHLLILLTSLLTQLPYTSPSSNHVHTQPKTAQPTTNIHPSELETLFKIMETMSSDTNWRVSHPNPCTTPASTWAGIECKLGNDNHLHVTRLDFGTLPNPLCKKTATFPSEVFSLPNLVSVFFHQCFTHTTTTITIPSLMSSMNTIPSTLEQLSLRSNPALTGKIPTQISSLKTLQVLTMSQNKLRGPIPPELFTLTSLIHLDLSYNSFSASIPPQVGSLRNLQGLDLSYNSLSGTIPTGIGNLGQLQKLDLSSNLLTGKIPNSITNLNSLNFLALSGNKLSGNFPDGLTNLVKLEYFIMDDNPMYMTLPVQLGFLSKLQELRLANCGYSGSIPKSFTKLANLTTLSLQNNRLTGEIPAGFSSLNHIYHLNLSRNFLQGAVPFNVSFMARLGKNLDLSENPGLCLLDSKADSNDTSFVACDSHKSYSFTQPNIKSHASKNMLQYCSYYVFLVIISMDLNVF
ncbi:hypothetical protein vseg_020978 [Gypsophila vaccaria]